MGPNEIRSFLSFLNNDRQIAGSTYSQALCALLFLYKEVLGIELAWIEGISRPKRPPKRPVVLTQTEIKLVLEQMGGVYRLVAQMLYGTGMRLFECAQLRIKDVDLQRREVLIREGKGGKDRITVLPLSLVQPLREQIGIARAIFEQDRAQGRPGMMLPYALERKYPKAGSQTGLVLGIPVGPRID
jgi:integrase